MTVRADLAASTMNPHRSADQQLAEDRRRPARRQAPSSIPDHRRSSAPGRSAPLSPLQRRPGDEGHPADEALSACIIEGRGRRTSTGASIVWLDERPNEWTRHTNRKPRVPEPGVFHSNPPTNLCVEKEPTPGSRRAQFPNAGKGVDAALSRRLWLSCHSR
jgi:hypothetical protein